MNKFLIFLFVCTFGVVNAQNEASNTRDARQLYLLINQDVSNANVDPWEHYQYYGKNEGRIWPALSIAKTPVNNDINARVYLAINQDVADAGINAWEHYQQYGKNEGRIWPKLSVIKDVNPTNCAMSGTMYLAIYPDVAKAGVNAWDHYQIYGIKEGRIWPGCKSTF
jgi:hypothetical protein